MESDDIEKLFQDAFENFEVTPPISAKQGIDNKLGIKKKGRFVFWLVPILLLLSGAIIFVVLNDSTHSNSTKHPFSSDSQEALVQSDQDTSPTSASEEINTSDKDEDPAGELKERSIKKEPGFLRTEQESHENKRQQSVSVQREQGHSELKTGSLQMNKLKLEKVNSKQPKKSVQNNLKITKRKELSESLKKEKSSNSDAGIDGVKTADSPVESKSLVLDKKDEKQEINQNEAKVFEEKQLADSMNKVADEIKTEKVNLPDTINQINPVQSAENSTEAEQPKTNSGKAQNWMVELYGGPRFGLKTSKSDFTLKEPGAYQIGLGFSRKVNLGPLKYVTLDGEYGAGKETYHQETTMDSIYFAGIDSVPYFDPITDSIIGYNYYNNYDTLTTKIEKNTSSQVTRFAFGLRAQFNFDLGKGFGIGVMPGYYYSMSKYRFSDSLNTTLSSSSSQISLGLSVYYDWNRFRFRVGLDSRYELMGKNQNAFIDRRKSLLFSPQFGVAFKF